MHSRYAAGRRRMRPNRLTRARESTGIRAIPRERRRTCAGTGAMGWKPVLRDGGTGKPTPRDRVVEDQNCRRNRTSFSTK
jgi:hypothetical protein